MLSFAVSPCSNPELALDEALAAYSAIGYTRFELFTSWARSAVEPDADPSPIAALGRRYGMAFSSIHLPPFDDSPDSGVGLAERTCRLGAMLGCRVALVKPRSRQDHADACRRLLDAVEGLPIIPVLQNHAGSAIETLDDYREVFAAVDDPRLKCTLEVGQFHSVGIAWPEAYEALADRFELVHIKDQIGRRSVPFGTGQMDLPGLLRRLAADAYAGDVVIEMEVADRGNTLQYLRDALTYVREHTPA